MATWVACDDTVLEAVAELVYKNELVLVAVALIILERGCETQRCLRRWRSRRMRLEKQLLIDCSSQWP
jgi:hypothetical protein